MPEFLAASGLGAVRQFDRPKVANLQRLMPGVYRAQPVLVAARK